MIKKQPHWIYIIFFFLFVNVIFNFSLWKEFFGEKITMSDNIVTEFLVEKSYQSIIHGKNPFITRSILYPFETNYSLNDPNTAYILPFISLRPFINSHQSLIIIVLTGFLLNSILIYFLLTRLKIRQDISLLVSLIFSFTPFLSYRVQAHYTYIPIYFFPLAYLIINQFLEIESKKNKYLLSIIFGLFLSIVLLSNFYYFLMILLGLFAFIGYFTIFNGKIFFRSIVLSFRYLIISIIIFCLTLIPWFISVYQLIRNDKLSSTPGFGGAITLSADLISFITPSEYNPIYKKIFSFFSLSVPYFTKYNDFFLKSWERFAYPGIIIIGVYFLIIFLKVLKKFPISLWNKIKPYFLMSLVFAVLMLGPFLKVFNRWSINLGGVAVVFPLPFLLLHYIPGLSTLRAPSRFTPIFIFFACIVVAYVFDFIIKKASKKKLIILIITLFILFFFDQLYVIPTKLNQEIPTKIYYFLKNKPRGTVLEIPFTVRDGFQYIGFVHAIQPMAGQLIHGKPIIGGYMARIPDNVFNYYKNLKFINYLANIIDKGNYIPLKEKPKEIKFYSFPYPINTAEKEIQSLNIKYVILKDDEKYSDYLLKLLKQMRFVEKRKDSNYLLLEK